MAATVKIKRSNTAAAVPTVVTGELAINQADKVLYVGDAAGAALPIAGLFTTQSFTYSSGSTLTLSRTPIGSVVLYWSPPGSDLSRISPSRYSVAGKTITLQDMANLWSALTAGDEFVVDYIGGAA